VDSFYKSDGFVDGRAEALLILLLIVIIVHVYSSLLVGKRIIIFDRYK